MKAETMVSRGIPYEPLTGGPNRPADADCPLCGGTGATTWETASRDFLRGQGPYVDSRVIAEALDICRCVERWDAAEVCGSVTGECDCDLAHVCDCKGCDTDGQWTPTCVSCRQAAAVMARTVEAAPCSR